MIKIYDAAKDIALLLLAVSLIAVVVGYISDSSILLLFGIMLSIPFLFVASVVIFISYVKEARQSKLEFSNKMVPDKVQTKLLNASDDFLSELLKNYPEKYYIKVSVVKDDFEGTTIPITKIFKGCK
ncbi:MAG: hypothetical protein KAV40_01520 [Thermoplasmatales archaeon]|nr:hypothetical protein [Thermoplasmatales archaeon]